ncbi:restriction endonuclease subunit S [Helicobacter pylori]|uniref:restriction endonuclease subunit S n=1 Tax=Helicobacter pylori TaxID=210 RepID=UPI000EB35AEC|nr:restriction endonuclease subunit S [Helicobacter pylori]
MIGPLSSQLNAIKWGEFKLGDLFEIRPTKAYNLTNPHLFDSNAKNPVVTNSSLNNGISGYSSLEPTEKGNQITYSDTTTSEGIFYQKRPFIGYSHVQGLYPLKYHEFWNEKTLLYIVVAFKKVACGRFDYGNKFNRKIASEMLILLPTTQNGGIDFDFMEKFIAELEQCRLAELEAYLKATGLENTTLSKDEENALNVFNGNNSGGGGGNTPCGLTWQHFKLGDLFEIEKTLSFNKDALTQGQDYDYITRTSQNQGVLQTTGFVNAENLNPPFIWSLGLLQMDFFYRKKSWYAGQFMRKITPKAEIKNKINSCTAHYFTTLLNAFKRPLLSVLVRDIDKTFREQKIQLPLKPTANTQTLDDVDFDFMRTLINALMKQTIQGVVQYCNAKIQATKEIISQETPIQKDSLF